jgi:aerobic carbon-monoxide dehydrogenase large subunit
VTDIPPLAFGTRNVPCRTDPLGVKGAGEAGAIGSCPAVMTAVADALWRGYRIGHVDMPATPERLRAAITAGRRGFTPFEQRRPLVFTES